MPGGPQTPNPGTTRRREKVDWPVVFARCLAGLLHISPSELPCNELMQVRKYKRCGQTDRQTDRRLLCGAHFRHTDWAREQGADPLWATNIHDIFLHSPAPQPPDLPDSFQPFRRPPILDVLALAGKRQLYHIDDDTVLLVLQPYKPHHTGTSYTSSTAPPPRIYFSMLMRPWVLNTSHAIAPCHLGVSCWRIFSWWIGMDIFAHWWIRCCLKCQVRKT